MKKNTLFSAVLLAAFFTSCSNFWSGSDLKDSIDDKITYTNTGSTTVSFFCNGNYGSIYPSEDQVMKTGTSIEVTFTKDQDFDGKYFFQGWKCVDKYDKTKDRSSFVKFSSEDDLVTSVTILKDVENLMIMPVVADYPEVVASFPADGSTDIAKDTPIILLFNNNMNNSDTPLLKSETHLQHVSKECESIRYGFETESGAKAGIEASNKTLCGELAGETKYEYVDHLNSVYTVDGTSYYSDPVICGVEKNTQSWNQYYGELRDKYAAKGYDGLNELNRDYIRIYCVEDEPVRTQNGTGYVARTIEDTKISDEATFLSESWADGSDSFPIKKGDIWRLNNYHTLSDDYGWRDEVYFDSDSMVIPSDCWESYDDLTEDYQHKKNVCDVTDFFVGQFDATGKSLSLYLSSRALLVYFFAHEWDKTSTGQDYFKDKYGIETSEKYIFAEQYFVDTAYVERYLPANTRLKIWISPELKDCYGNSLSEAFESTFVTSDKKNEETEQSEGSSTNIGGTEPVIFECSATYDKVNKFTDETIYTRSQTSNSEDEFSIESGLFDCNDKMTVSLKAGCRLGGTNSLIEAGISKVHLKLCPGYLDDNGQFQEYESTTNPVWTVLKKYCDSYHPVLEEDYSSDSDGYVIDMYKWVPFTANAPWIDSYYRVKVTVIDMFGNESSPKYLLFYKKTEGPLKPWNSEAYNWELFKASNSVKADDGKLYAYPCFIENIGAAYFVITCCDCNKIELNKEFIAVDAFDSLTNGGEPVVFDEKNKVYIGKTSSGTRYVLYDGLKNEQDYTFAFNLADSNGTVTGTAEVTRTVNPTAGLYRKTIGSGSFGSVLETQNVYFGAEETCYYSMPASEAYVSGDYKTTVTPYLYLNKSLENTDSANWEKVSVNGSQQFTWPDESVDTYYAMIFYEAQYYNKNELSSGSTTRYFSKAFKIERGTEEAEKRVVNLGKILYSDATISSVSDYKTRKYPVALGLIIDVYDEDDGVDEADFYTPKTIWSFNVGGAVNQKNDSSGIANVQSQLNSFNTDCPFDWRLPDAGEMSLMWRFFSQMQTAESAMGISRPSDSGRLPVIGGVLGQNCLLMYFARGSWAVTEGVPQAADSYYGYMWPVADVSYKCSACGTAYPTLRTVVSYDKDGRMIYTCPSCGNVSKGEIASDYWTSDGNYHWHVSKDAGASESAEKIEHVWSGNWIGVKKCSICGYLAFDTSSGYVTVPSATINGTESWAAPSGYPEKEFISGRKLTIPKLFVCDHEVTRAEYMALTESDPSLCTAYDKDGNELTGDDALDNPVNYVRWYEAIEYCNMRSEREGLTPCYTIDKNTVDSNINEGYNTYDTWKWTVTYNSEANGWRLPTSVEWEWLARGGESYLYAGSNTLSDVAWYYQTEKTGTRTIRTKKANGFGLYDMCGNVEEWCWDYSGDITTSTGLSGPTSGMGRISRGGSWNDKYGSCYLSARHYSHANYRSYSLSSGDTGDVSPCGFRVVRTVE